MLMLARSSKFTASINILQQGLFLSIIKSLIVAAEAVGCWSAVVAVQKLLVGDIKCAVSLQN